MGFMFLTYHTHLTLDGRLGGWSVGRVFQSVHRVGAFGGSWSWVFDVLLLEREKKSYMPR